MKVTLNWLKQYVDFNWSPEELTTRLTLLGLEVEGIQKLSGAFDGIVVAQVLTRDKHPNADKLSLCRVNDGTGERQIVCGAQNFNAGDKVPLILPGASLPLKAGETEPFTIKVGKIRGVESHGMLCSPQELGLPDQVDGLLILREDAKVGQPFGEYLGRSGSDVIYDLEVTPNRPDLNSVIGIAREISALTGNPLRMPDSMLGEVPPGSSVGELVTVRVDDSEMCPRYTARVIKGVKVGPSPDWLKSTLEKAGIRSISNVVDVTNYVMLETGQPLHAFDYHLIAKGAGGKPTIVVRRAATGEKFRTLDNVERTLADDTLLIADEQKGIALAGVMGGANTEINDQTRDVLIESAYFTPVNIRRTSKRLGLRSESSYRFERGADIEICEAAGRRAAKLILGTAGGELVSGVVDARPQTKESAPITLHFAKTDALLGVGISHAEQLSHLTKLGLTVTAQAPGEATFQIPSWRVDLKREVDLIEEVGRLHGVDRLPSTPPRGAIGFNEFDSVYDQIFAVRQIMTSLGLYEAQGQTLISKDEVRGINAAEIVALANPLSSDMDVLRPSLLPGLIHSLRHNASRKNSDVALFEIGRVFSQAGGAPREGRRVAVAIMGRRALPFWSGAEREVKFDAYDLKGLVEDLLEQFGLRGLVFTKRPDSTALFLESAVVTLGGKLPLGELGQLLPPLAKKYDLREAVFLAEFDLDLLLSKRNPLKSFKALPQFPSSRRDVAILVPEATTHDAVLTAVKQAKPANLEAMELFDVFRGQGVPSGQKSLAYTFTYRATDKTLTDVEVNSAHEKAVDSLKQKLAAVIR